MAERRMPLRAIAAELGCSVETIRAWLRAGMPGRKVGGVWHFDAQACAEWRRSRERGPSGEQRRADVELRKAIALAESRELDLAVRRGQLVRVAEVQESVAARFDAVRRRLLGFARSIAPQLEGLGRAEIERTLRAELIDALEHAAGGPLPAPAASEGEGDAAAAP